MPRHEREPVLIPIPVNRRRLPLPGNAAADRQRLRRIVLWTVMAAAAAWSLASVRPAPAAEELRTFGAPTVLSARGQRLKVVVPMVEAAGIRASAAAFAVEQSQAASGFDAPTPEGFTVMRPSRSPYVVFQSAEVVEAPAVSLTFAVAGDPKSPYQMDLAIPTAAYRQPEALARVASAGREAGVSGLATRRITGPAPRADLPPK